MVAEYEKLLPVAAEPPLRFRYVLAWGLEEK
jgi:hypothetical protein